MATEAAVAVAAVADTDKYILTGRTLGSYDDVVAGYLDLTPGAMTVGVMQGSAPAVMSVSGVLALLSIECASLL